MLVNEQRETIQADSHILHPSTRALFRFWEAVRAERAAPARDEIDLKRLRSLVPNLMLIDRGAGDRDFRWRLAGTGICNVYRRELTGTDVLDGWDSFERDVIGRFLDNVATRLQPCVMRFRLHSDQGDLIGTESICLPVLAQNGTVQIFGGLFPFRDSELLEYKAIAAMDLSGGRAIWTEHLPGDHLAKDIPATRPFRSFRPFQVIPGGRG